MIDLKAVGRPESKQFGTDPISVKIPERLGVGV